MLTYVAWMPVTASVRYTLTTEKPIRDSDELRRRMIAEGKPAIFNLCPRCASDVEVDLEWIAESADSTDFEPRKV